MRRPIMLSHIFPTFCYFGRQNLFHEKASPFQDFVIPALDQETYGEFLQFGPGLGVFTFERFSYTEEDSWKASLFQDFVIPALDQETYGEFLQWGPGLGVFTLERFSRTKEDSRVTVNPEALLIKMIQVTRTQNASNEKEREKGLGSTKRKTYSTNTSRVCGFQAKIKSSFKKSPNN